MTLCVVVSAGVLVGIHMYVYILYSGFFCEGKNFHESSRALIVI